MLCTGLTGDPPPTTTKPSMELLLEALAAVLTRNSSSANQGPLEEALNRSSLPAAPSSNEGSWTTGSSRNAEQTRILLVRALVEQPEHFVEAVQRGIARAYHQPEGSATAHTTRDYVENRSRLTSHRPTINWMWIISGALDCLLADPPMPQQAAARLSLALVAGEQLSIDGGSWQLAWQYVLEDEPPYSHFNRAATTSETALPVPITADPRWVETAMARLKNLDSLVEMRRRLAKASTTRPSEETEEMRKQRVAKAAAKGKAKGAAKGEKVDA